MDKRFERAKVYSDFGSIVNIREKSNASSKVAFRLDVGAFVQAKKYDTEWSIVQCEKGTGYVMNQFLVYGES